MECIKRTRPIEQRTIDQLKMSSPIAELSYSQYQKILRFWRLIEATEKCKYDLAERMYRLEDVPYFGVEQQLQYWEQEYKAYIERIGFRLGDREMSEPLFQLINQGVIM